MVKETNANFSLSVWSPGDDDSEWPQIQAFESGLASTVECTTSKGLGTEAFGLKHQLRDFGVRN